MLLPSVLALCSRTCLGCLLQGEYAHWLGGRRECGQIRTLLVKGMLGTEGDELEEVSRGQNLTVPGCCDNPLDVDLQEMRVLGGSGSIAMLSSVCFS